LKTVLIYSECPFFGGSENVIPVLLKDSELNKNFRIVFYYKYSKKYVEGLQYKIDVKQFEISSIQYNHENLLQKIKLGRFFKLIEFPIIIMDVLIQLPKFKLINPDLIFINNGGYPAARTCRSAVFTAKLVGIKNILFMVNNIAVPYKTIKRFIDYPVDHYIKKFTDLFLTASQYAKDALMDVLKLNNNKILLALNTFDTKSVTTTPQKLKLKLNLEKDSFIIGTVGELAKRKGHHVLIDAIKNISKTLEKKIIVLIIGDGPEKEVLEKMIHDYNLSESIKLIPFTDNIFNYYNIFDLYVHPTVADDDLPFTVREAMSLGLPIIASEFAGIPELIEHENNGILVEPNQPEKLSAQIHDLIINEDKRNLLGENSRKVFEKKLSKKVILKNYQQIFSRYTT
jgi:L-malate glycosyltransferase